MKEAQGYVHAAQMMEFAQDAAKFPRPWELWEIEVEEGIYKALTSLPVWCLSLVYRRHKHADPIGAWQLGAEVQMKVGESWNDVDPKWMSRYEYRIKPKTININGYEVPEPVREDLESGHQYWVASTINPEVPLSFKWYGRSFEVDFYNCGLIHFTEEAASIHAQALLSFTRAK